MTWQAFLEVAQQVRGLGTDIYGYGASAWWGPYATWLNAAGGGFFNEERNAYALNTPESLAGLDFERPLYQDYDVATPYGEDPEPTFRAGKVAMFQNGRWATLGVRTVEFNSQLAGLHGRYSEMVRTLLAYVVTVTRRGVARPNTRCTRRPRVC